MGTIALVSTTVLTPVVLGVRPAAAATPPAGSAGALDSSWGSNGMSTVTVSGSPSLVSANRALVLNDGSTIVAGSQAGQAGSVVIAKFTPSGTLDPSFGSGGLAHPGLGSGSTPDPVSLALQPSTGDIVVGGSIKSGSITEMALKRLTPSGAVDTTFGTNGLAALATLGGFSFFGTVSMAVAPSGAVAVIPRRTDNGDDAMLVQYSANGVLDASFGAKGIADVDSENPPAYLQDVTYTPDGHVVVAGYATAAKQTDTLVGRFLANGQSDTTFPGGNGPGFETFDLSGAAVNDTANAVQIDPSGHIVVAGTISTSSSSAYALRLQSTGAKDASFGTNGLITGSFDGSVGTATAVAIDSTGRYLVSGGSAASGTSVTSLGVERLTSGSNPYDPSFGVSTAAGRESIACPSGGIGTATAVVAAPNQHTIVAGSCNGSLVVARLNGGNLSNLTMTTSTPQAPAGHGTIPLSQVPNSALAATTASLIGAPGFGSPGFGSPGFGSPGFGSPGFGSPGFGSPGFGSPITQSVLTDPVLGSIPLSQIPLSANTPGAPASWDALLAGTSLAGLPTQSVTLQQVLALSPAPPALQNVTLGDLDLSNTLLRQATLGAFLMGTTPISSLPAPNGSWCTFLTGQPDNCSTNARGTAQSLMDLELGGDSLQSFYANSPINLVGLAVTNSPLTYLPINDIDMSLTTLGSTLTTTLRTPARFVTCTPSATSSTCDNLVDAQKSGNLQPGASVTLEALLADSPAAVGTLTLSNLLGGLVSRENLPVENIPLSSIIASSPLPTSGAAYQINFNLGCSAASSLAVTPALPAGFRIIAGTVSMTVGSGASATNAPVTVNPNGSITPTPTLSCSGTQPVTVNLQAEPSTILGPTTAGVSVSVSSDTLALSNQAPVQVTKNFIVNDTANPANNATFDTLYAGHIASPGDLDYFSLPAPPAGSVLTVTLSHLPNDDDLVVYGPAVPELRATPGFGSPGFGSPGFGSPGFGSPGFGSPGFGSPGFGSPGFGSAAQDPTTTFDDNGTASHPTLDPDVPRLNLPVRGFSDQRGTADESITTRISSSDTTPFLIQVSGYNGSWSNQPYVLRVSVTPPPPAAQCQARTYGFTGTAGQLPATPLRSSTQTLFLVDQQRLGAIYGNVSLTDGSSGDAGQVVVSHLQTLAQQSSVAGVVVPIEGDPTVAAAYAAWDRSPCDPAAANQVVSAINAVVDRLRTGLPNLKNVVLVGDDEVVPFGRVLDYTSAFNEAGFSEIAFNGVQNAESSAAANGYLLSDNPYGDLAPEPFLSSQLYVPQLAVGRLVETPGDIVGQINSYVSAGGVTNPSSAFVTGYAPFDKGAQQVSSVLAGDVGGANSTAQINSTWDRSAAIAGLNSAAHGYAVINAHYDIYRALPGNGDATNPLSTADLPSSLSGGVDFTIGCHAGLNVPDIYIGNPNQTQAAQLLDWPQAELHNQAAAFAGNTGYGLGDTDAIAFSERMNTLFAQNLGPAMTIGQAMAFAKQQYVASVGQPSVYDAKAVEEDTFYGLPMWRVGANGQSATVALPPAPPDPSAPVTLATSSQDTQITNFSLTAAASGRGSYYSVGTQAPQVTPGQPIEPLVAVSLPARTDGLVAHGAIIEQLQSADISRFQPVYDTPVVDSASFNPEPAITNSFFPSALQSVSGTVSASGRHDSLDLVAGQFFSDGSPAGTGMQRLYSDIQSTVLSSNSDNYTPPRISSVAATVQGSVARFTVTSPDSNVMRGVILMLVAGSSSAQKWQHVELVNAGNGQWVGTTALPAGTTSIGQYFAQLANSNGNVGVSSNKGQDFSAGSVGGFTVSVSPPPDPNTGLYTSPSTVTLTPPAGTTATYTLDGGASTPYTGPITITGNGGHTLVATASNGVTSTFGFPIDVNPPAVAVSTPANGATYDHAASLSPSYTCSSAVTLVSCVGPSTVDLSTLGTHTYTVTATDIFGRQTSLSSTYTVTDSPPTVSVTSGPADGTGNTTATFQYTMSDPDDPGSSLTASCTLDGVPVACGSSSATVTGLAPSTTPHQFVVTASDPWGQSAQAVYSWRVFYSTTTTSAQVIPSVPNVSATLTYNPQGGSPTPLPGQTVTFYAGQNQTGGSPLCSAVTDSNGNAACGGLGATLAAAGSGGVTAVFAGSPPYLGSSGSAGVL